MANKEVKPRTGLTREEHRVIVENPGKVQAFLDSTRQHGGASMYLHDMSMVNPGDKTYLVGKEPSRKTKQPVATEYEDRGSSEPNISAQQFAQHFMRLKGHATTTKGTVAKKLIIGSWVNKKNEEETKKGVQMDLSGGYKDRRTAEKKMIDRNEDAIADASNYFDNIYHEDVRHRYTDTPRPPKED